MKNKFLEAEEKRLCKKYECSTLDEVLIKQKKILRDAKNG